MKVVLRLLYTLQLQRVCRQAVKVEGWIHSQGSPCGVFGEQSDNTTGFSRVFPPLPVNIHLPLTYLSFFEALLYKPEGRGLDFQWCHWKLSMP
jgi:hypothetical protein